jgi:hypothetical protein
MVGCGSAVRPSQLPSPQPGNIDLKMSYREVVRLTSAAGRTARGSIRESRLGRRASALEFEDAPLDREVETTLRAGIPANANAEAVNNATKNRRASCSRR